MKILALGAAAFYLLDVVIMVFTSFLIAYVLSPLHEKLVKWGTSRFLSCIVIVATFVVTMVSLLIYSIPKLYIQALELFKFFYSMYKLLIDQYPSIFAEYFNTSLSTMLLNRSNLSKALILVSNYGYDTLNMVFDLMAIIMMVFYMLRDWDLWRSRLLNLISEEHRAKVNIFFEEVMYSLKIWLYGQMLVTMFLFIYYLIALTYINMPFALLLASLFSVLSVVPYVGDFFATVITVSILAGYQPFLSNLALYAGIVLIIGFMLENVFLIPSFIGKKAGIHPMLLLILFLIFGKVLGLKGIMLTVPLSLIFVTIWRTGLINRKWF